LRSEKCGCTENEERERYVLEREKCALGYGDASKLGKLDECKMSNNIGDNILAQLVMFLVVELTHTCSNIRFGMCVIFMGNYSFSVGDFMNLKINQSSLLDVFIGVGCMCVFIG
jgi:hypothetical protein